MAELGYGENWEVQHQNPETNCQKVRNKESGTMV